MNLPVVVIGGGPAGLTAAWDLVGNGVDVEVLESESQFGGISRTIRRQDRHFDLGGHRFFTRSSRVRELWQEMLPADDWLVRRRRSRIVYHGRFFDYPLRPVSALRTLGAAEAVRCVASLAAARVTPGDPESSMEAWVSSRFGRRLYSIFFASYTEKVWGRTGAQISADWARQRIGSMSLWRAVADALGSRRHTPKSLIQEFAYPRLGPGMLWDTVAADLAGRGAEVRTGATVRTVERTAEGGYRVGWDDGDGQRRQTDAGDVVATMPLPDLVAALVPAAPPPVAAAAARLTHRSLVTVALAWDGPAGFDDTWIYVHDPAVRVGRIQNFASWSPEMVPDGTTCLGLEYFTDPDGDIYRTSDEDLVALGRAEIDRLGLAGAGAFVAGHVVRVPHAYPVYDDGYRDALATIRAWLGEEHPGVFPVGRNGLHRYDNQDHAMLTGLAAAELLTGRSTLSPWDVDMGDDYIEAPADDDGDRPVADHNPPGDLPVDVTTVVGTADIGTADSGAADGGRADGGDDAAMAGAGTPRR